MAQARAYSQARPVRVAYLVDPHAEHGDFVLDAIFTISLGRWGGRFSPIIPASPAGPDERYLGWLSAFDPDVIYSYVDLDEAVIERLHEQLYPSFLIKHETYRRSEADEHAFQPRLPISGLSAATLLPLAAMPSFGESRGVKVIEAMGHAISDRFIRDSFGLFTYSIGRGFGPPFSEYGEVLTVVADDEAQPRARYIRPGSLTVKDIRALLDAIATDRVVTMSQLSAMAAPRLEIPAQREGAFNLVVGDSFDDRLLFWNARSLFPFWRDNEFVDLRLPEALLDDDDFLPSLAQFLRRRNHVTWGSSNSAVGLEVRSTSIPADKLEAFAARLRAEQRGWMTCTAQFVSDPADWLPTEEHLSHSTYRTRDRFLNPAGADTHECYAAETSLEMSPPVPDHLRYSSPALASSYSGVWAVDIDVERQVDYSPVSNVRHRWRLPRRLRMTSAFLKGFTLGSSEGLMPRVNSGGLLTAYASAQTRFPQINLPTDESAVATALLVGRDWWPFEYKAGAGEQMPQQLLADVRRSSNGRYFWGALGLVGGLEEAKSILLHKFWLEIFDVLGGSRVAREARREQVSRRLGELSQEKALVPGSDEYLQQLAEVVLDEADRHRTQTASISWTELKRRFHRFEREGWKRDNAHHLTEAQKKEWRDREFASFKSRVQDLCKGGILYQGYEHTCRTCLHTAWIAIGRLSGQITCEVCAAKTPAPVDRTWDFRLNEFLRESLRKHGFLPLVWCLSRQESMREISFFFEGPLEVYPEQRRDEGGRPETDIDLTCIADGEVRMCEVKQSATQLDRGQRDHFITIVKRLRPDVAVLAVMEPPNPTILDFFAPIESELAGTGIRPQLITLDDRDIEDRGTVGRIQRIRLF